MSALAITAIVLGALGVFLCFVPRLPGVLSSYAGLSCAWFAGVPYVDGSVMVFWFVATVLVIGIGVFAPYNNNSLLTRRGNFFVVVGAIAGALLGYVAAPTAAAVITGSAVGVVLGALAFRSTRHELKALPLYSTVFVNFLCSTGLRAVVACSMCGITVASVL